MEIKELAAKIVKDITDAPTVFDSLKLEVEKVITRLVKDNIVEVSKIKSEEDFYNLITEIADLIIKLPQPWESVDGIAIKMILKKVIDPMIDRVAGKDWYEKFSNWLSNIA